MSFSWPRAALLGVLVFGAGDLVQRKFIPPPIKNQFHLKQPHSHTVFHPDPGVLRGMAGESHLTVNSLGIRGPEWPPRASAYRILCVGNSVTECLYLDDKETWPAVIMQRLNQETNMSRVWVGNVGKAAYGSYHHLRFLKGSALLKEIDCVVLMVGQADLSYALTGITEIYERPERTKRKSYIETFFRDVRKKFEKKGVSLDIEDLRGQVHVARRKARMEAEKCDVLPDLTEPLNRFRQRLREMAEVCRERRVRLVFVTPFSFYRKDLPPEDRDILWGGKLADGRYLTERAMRDGYDVYRQALLDVAKEMNVECVDLSSLSGRSELFYDGAHFNVEGARRVGNLVGDYFLAHRSGNRWQPDAKMTRLMPAR
jgi:lysophospholipase L1-like esterase